MLGHTLLSFLINGSILTLIGFAIHQIGYYRFTKPAINWTPVITYFLLSLFTYVFPIAGYIFSLVVAGYLIWRENRLYKLGAIAFIIALVATATTLFIGQHIVLIFPIRF